MRRLLQKIRNLFHRTPMEMKDPSEIPVPKHLRHKFPGAITLADVYQHPNFLAHYAPNEGVPNTMSHYDATPN